MSVNIPTTSLPRIVIIGGGFAGIELVKSLRSIDAQIVLIDKNNYHTFQPLLYQVATAALEPDSIAYPFREIFKNQSNFIFRMADVASIKTEEKRLETSIGTIDYDYLVIAVGSETNYLGKEEFEKNAVPMKSVPQAMALRNLILENLEKALLTNDLMEREALMNFVIVGGGPTGVEMAGALGELKKIVLPHDYPELDINRMQIHVIEMADRLLSSMSPQSSESAERFLKRFDINIWPRTKVDAYDGKTLLLSNGKKLGSYTVIWSAGVKGSLIPGLKPESIVFGRLKVDEHNKVLGYENVFALGDIAAMISKDYPRGHPMLAPVAIKQARTLAKNLRRLFKKAPLKPFVYRDWGVMATIGRNHAVVELPFVKFRGLLAWFVWLFVHLMALVGFRNKIVAFVNWAWNYFSYDRGLRLILRPFLRK